MQDQDRSVAGNTAIRSGTAEASSPVPTSVPRRRLLRALSGVAIGVVALAGLTGCGGEDEEGDEEDD